jgi:alcohol dehydrogenase (cytochrome c)
MDGKTTALTLLIIASLSAHLAFAASTPQAPAAAAPAEDGNWSMPAKNYASTRFSGLDELNTSNVKDPKVAFTFSSGVARGQESAPLVVGGTLYFVSPYPNIVYALDLTQPGAPIKWQYNPEPLAASQGVACCDTVNRGPTFADGKVIFNTLDNHTIAVDAETGKPAWNVTMGDISKARA